MADDGTWVASSGSAFITTDSAVANTIAAALSETMLEVSDFFTDPPAVPFLVSVVTL
jgi:hypothetical protein